MVDPRLAEVMDRYRGFVAGQERLGRLQDLEFSVRQFVYKDGPDGREETLNAEMKVLIKPAQQFSDWQVRVETESQGQELVLVATPGRIGFGVLGGVLQGHPVYGRRARLEASNWAQFVLRWLNPDMPMFGARYDGRIEQEGRRPLDRVLLTLRDSDTREPVGAWRLLADGSTGAPISLESFSTETFELEKRLDYKGYAQVSGIRLPQRVEVLDPDGKPLAALAFSGWAVDTGLDPAVFRKPGP